MLAICRKLPGWCGKYWNVPSDGNVPVELVQEITDHYKECKGGDKSYVSLGYGASIRRKPAEDNRGQHQATIRKEEG